MVRRIGLQQAKQGGDDVPPLQGHPGLSDASEGTGVPESRGEVGVQDPEHHDGARDTRWRDDRMTGRRSHGRLSALNGVVHQGSSLGFIVTRDQSIDVQAGSELEWIREFWARTPRVLVVRLTARWIAKQLSRLRGTRKHDEPERQLGKLLDTYVRLYVGGQVKKRRRKRVRSKGQG